MEKITKITEKHGEKIVWFFILLYVTIFSVICIWKYNNFLYNGLDLGIINNVFYNSLDGNWLWSSIQGHNYFGDHFTPILFIILPIYAIYPSAITLLVLQTLFLGLTAWVIYKISLNITKQKTLSVLISLLWLINPLVHNINLFEFHFISLAPIIILSAFYYYLKIKNGNEANKTTFLYYFIFIFLSLLIREDIAFILLGLILIMISDWIKSKKNKALNYKIIRLLISSCLMIITYSLIAFKLVGVFSPSSVSPFIYYYGWLGSSASEIIKNIFLKFDLVLKHLVTLGNFEMITGLLLPFLFLPLLKPKYLWLGFIPAGQIMLSAAGGGALVWQLHYAALFLPGLVIGFIYGFKKLNKFINRQLGVKYLLIIALIGINVYLGFYFGPFAGKSPRPELALMSINKKNLDIKNMCQQIPASESVLSSYDFQSNLSSRQNIYSLHYYFLGQQQFAQAEYILPESPDYVLIDFDEFTTYQIHLKNLAWSKQYYTDGRTRMDNLLKNYGSLGRVGEVYLLGNNMGSEFDFNDEYEQHVIKDSNLTGGVEIAKWRTVKRVIDFEK